MYCRMMVNRARAYEEARYDGDHICRCVTAWFIAPVNSWWRSRAETPLRLFTGWDRAMVGG
jgi:hypothetical protein